MDKKIVLKKKGENHGGIFQFSDKQRKPIIVVKKNHVGQNSVPIDPQRDFYFANTYPQDCRKAQIMQGNIRADLAPFSAYIRASINHIRRSTAEGADVVIADKLQESYLVPQFSLIKPSVAGAVFSIPKLQGVYALSSDDEFDSDSFEISSRQGQICSHKDKIDSYNGSIFIKLNDSSTQTISGRKFDLYDDDSHKDESVKCTISQVNYADISSYRIEGVSIESAEETESEIVLHTNADISALKEIELFGQAVKINKKNSAEQAKITGQNVSVKAFSDSLYVVSPALPKEKRIQLFANGKPVKYSVVSIADFSESELQALLNTKDISLRNGRLVYNGAEEKSVLLNGLKFTVQTEKLSFRKQLRDKKDNFIGTIIEVLTDTKSIKDLESNTDAFFKDTTERLTDSLPFRLGKSRSFKIGRSDEDQNLLEIAEEIGGKLTRIENLPNHLYAVPDDWQLQKQKIAIEKLSAMPCGAFQGLLELFVQKTGGNLFCAKWKQVRPAVVSEWYLLTKEDYNGCGEQREFVQKALATPDFAFLDGPPGSGKTTSLLELIAQLVMQGKKVLLTASTNAAVDNILERLNKLPPEIQDKILAVRIGNEGAISETVSNYTLSGIPEEYKDEIVRRANLVCGTIFGVLKHPAFKLNDRNQPVRPMYDYLIIDEASKTTFQDFLIPALYSKHWVLSGDLKQLTPYVEQDTIQSSLEEMPEFDKTMQFVQTILCLAKDNRIATKNMRFYITVNADVIKAAEELVCASPRLAGIICNHKSENPYAVSVQELKQTEQKAAILYGAKLLFIEDSALAQVRTFLPADFVPMYDVAHDEHYADRFLAASVKRYFSAKPREIELGSFRDRTKYNSAKGIAEYWTKAAKEHSWAQELTWRMCRIQELFLEADGNKTVERYKNEIAERMPAATEKREKVEAYCNALTGIALPSILQLLQNGLSKDVRRNFKPTTLNEGFDTRDFEQRHTMLTFQHRMHPAISDFSAQKIYNGEALKDGSEMNEVREWDCSIFGQNRDMWLNTDGKINRDCVNENQIEINMIKQKIREFMQWTALNSNPAKDSNGKWSVACLTYYKRQERLLKQAVRELFGEQREKSHYDDENRHVEVFIYTVDKFQGREADVVFLSLIKSGNAPLGFMDSPNRLNVALTRARFQRVIVGSHTYFRNTKKSKLFNELAELAAVVKNEEVTK